MNPATEIDSSQQCHSAKQAASIPETTWYAQQQRGVADYTCMLATLLTCIDPSELDLSPASVALFITAGVSHAPRHEAELDTRGQCLVGRSPTSAT